jgi:predicted CoA-binding protein
MNSESTIRSLLSTPARWAVVGLSPRPERASHDVAKFLQHLGFEIVPVNPLVDVVLDQRAYPSLLSIPARIDVVDIFRSDPGPHVDEAIAIGASAVWMQLGVIDEAAAERARAAGLDVVMDRCPKIEYRKLDLA